MAKKVQVAIVGGGPVGVALGVDLATRGISAIVLEKRTGLQNIPKGQNLTQRTLEHFYFWGIADELRAARAMPPGYPIGNLTAYRTLSSDYWNAPEGREIVRSFYYQDNERLPQYQLEMVLRKKAETLPGLECRFGWSVRSIEQTANGVRVTADEENGSGQEVIEADYVVGCDGSHSIVREQAGIARVGTDFDQLMVLAVFRSRDLHEGLKRFPERSTYRVVSEELNGYWQFFGRIDVGEGWFFHAPVPANTTRENFDFHGMLEKIAGFKMACEFDYVGFWDLRVSVAETYRAGRIFIAGDAAHSHPPYGGYGLNNGLEDAVNLSWKLAAVLKGWGGADLLNSYGDERRPVFRDTGEDFIASRIRSEGELLSTYSPEKNKADFERVWRDVDVWGRSTLMSYEPNYEGSSVVFGPPDGKSGAHGKHMIKARAGHHLTPAPLTSGRNVFDELSRDFTLLAFDVSDADVAAFKTAAQKLAIPLKIVRDTFAGGRERYESRLILVRPDQYVVWVADAVDDAEGVLARAAGRR